METVFTEGQMSFLSSNQSCWRSAKSIMYLQSCRNITSTIATIRQNFVVDASAFLSLFGLVMTWTFHLLTTFCPTAPNTSRQVRCSMLKRTKRKPENNIVLIVTEVQKHYILLNTNPLNKSLKVSVHKMLSCWTLNHFAYQQTTRQWHLKTTI